MKILVNLSNLKMGGALQVAYSFLVELLSLKSNEHEFHVVLSKELENEFIDKEGGVFSKFKVYKLQNQPAYAFKGKKARKELDNLENLIKPSCVFSVFGPTYWKPKTIHVAGFAAGWTINPDSIAFDVLSFKEKIKKKFQNKIKLKSSVSETDLFIVETEVVRQRLNKYGKVSLGNIHVVGNTYGNQYNQKIDIESFKLPPKSNENEFRLVTISANYPHKNLKILCKLVDVLKNRKVNVKFYVTLKENEYNSLFKNYDDYIVNLGHVKVQDCPAVYKQCDALFLPTLLESFTASYVEAMIMELPILTSDIDFARNLCGEAALYFNPLDAKDIADKIELLISDKTIFENLVTQGSLKIKDYPTAKERAQSYISVCEKVIK